MYEAHSRQEKVKKKKQKEENLHKEAFKPHLFVVYLTYYGCI